MSLIIGKVEHLFIWFVVVQSLNRSRLFLTPWTEACQASLSFTMSRSLLKPISIELVMPSNQLIFCHPLLFLPSVFPSIRVFSNESALCISGQSIGASASASVLPMNIQGWFPLGLTGLISLLFKGLSRVFSNTIVRRHQLFSAQLFLSCSSHMLNEHFFLWTYSLSPLPFFYEIFSWSFPYIFILSLYIRNSNPL